jgi:DNA-binding GntR family transcriptional regulator
MPAIDRGAPEPLYRQLAAVLREQIRSGELAGMIPSIRHLAVTYDLGEITVRKALDILKEERLIVAVPGRGTFTAPRIPPPPGYI